MILKVIFRILACLAIILTIFPFLAADAWWIRMFDFPHVQLTFLTLFILLIYFFKFERKNWKDYLFILALVTCFIVQGIKIYPYTPFAPYEVNNSSKDKSDLKVYVANVLQKNKKHQKVIQQIEAYRPDLFLLTETNQAWLASIDKVFHSEYPYQIKVPLPNTYGMLLYSKKELIQPQVHYLIEDSIPSLDFQLKIKNRLVQLYVIHPKPPMPQHAKTSEKRDAEMMLVAKKIHQQPNQPHIVLGDFNDVAWSRTTTLFQEVSQLLDVRKGRGFFNTYDANSFLMRWPLDHIFVSKEFRVNNIELGKDNHSDHFPIYTELRFEPEKANSQQKNAPSSKELKQAEKEMN